MSSTDKLVINGKTLTSLIKDNNDPFVNDIASSGTSIKVTKKSGTTNTVALQNTLPNIISAGSVGPTGNSTQTISGQNNVPLSIPQVTYDAQGRVKSITVRTITVK